MTQRRKLLIGVILAAAFLAGTVPPASALILPLSVANIGFAGPYGTVTIDWIDTLHARITYDSSIVGSNIFLFGDGGSVGLNFNGGVLVDFNAVTASNAGTGFTPGPFTNGGAGNQDGFGSFNFTMNDFDGFSHSADHISFIATNTSGTWADENQILTPNADGYLASAHVFYTSYPANETNGAIATGFAANGDLTTVPEPASLFTLGSGLLGVALLQLRRRKKA